MIYLSLYAFHEMTMDALKQTLSFFIVVFLVNFSDGLSSPPPVRPDGRCEQDWYQYEKNCYKVFGDDPKDRTSWSEARDKCRSLGEGHELASIHSIDEQMFLTSLIPYHEYNLWIGMYSESGGIDVFKWSDGTNITFTYWMPHLLRSYWTKTCAWLSSDFYSAGRWNRTFCEREGNHGYICKTSSVPNAKPRNQSVSGCGDKNFVGYNNACYRILNSRLTWGNAESACSSMGGHLSSVNSPYEQAFLHNFIGGRRQVWLGLYDNQGYGLYRWADEWPVLYTSWEKDEPNYGREGEAHCVTFDGESKRWRSTTNCSQLNSFICKKSEENPPNVQYDKYNGKCPSHLSPRFDYGGRHCYHIGKVSWKSWGDASMYCVKQGGQLATITFPEQSSLLWAHLGSVDFQLWIGLLQKFDGQFGWIDGNHLNFTNWYPTRFPQGDCAFVSTADMRWRKDKCLGGFYFYQSLCMIKKDPL